MAHKFFNKKNFITAGWQIIILILGIIIGLFIHFVKPPEKVYITNREGLIKKDTLITIVQFQGDSSLYKYQNQLNEKFVQNITKKYLD
jgi:hypothetical protein